MDDLTFDKIVDTAKDLFGVTDEELKRKNLLPGARKQEYSTVRAAIVVISRDYLNPRPSYYELRDFFHRTNHASMVNLYRQGKNPYNPEYKEKLRLLKIKLIINE